MTQAQVIIEEYPTKSQIQQLLRAWGVGDELPTKGMPSRLIVWPKNSDVEVESACIQFSDRTSDAGESLYRLRMGPSDQLVPLVNREYGHTDDSIGAPKSIEDSSSGYTSRTQIHQILRNLAIAHRSEGEEWAEKYGKNSGEPYKKVAESIEGQLWDNGFRSFGDDMIRDDATLIHILESGLAQSMSWPEIDSTGERRFSSAALTAEGIIHGYLSGFPFKAVEHSVNRLIGQIDVDLHLHARGTCELSLERIHFLKEASSVLKEALVRKDVLPEINAFGGTVLRGMLSEDMFHQMWMRDNEAATCDAEKWHGIPTGQEPYSWAKVNLAQRSVITYTEGDFTRVNHTDDDGLRQEINSMVDFYIDLAGDDQIYDEMMDIHPLLDFALGSFGRAHEHPAERSDEDGRPRSTQGMGM